MWLIWRAAIVKRFTLAEFIVYALAVVISILVYYIDTYMFVYVVEDDDE